MARQYDAAAIEAQAIKQLRAGIARAQWLKAADVQASSRPDYIRKRMAGSTTEQTLAVSPKAFGNWFTSDAHMQAAAKSLAKGDRLTLPGSVDLLRLTKFGTTQITTAPRFNGHQLKSVQFRWAVPTASKAA